MAGFKGFLYLERSHRLQRLSCTRSLYAGERCVNVALYLIGSTCDQRECHVHFLPISLAYCPEFGPGDMYRRLCSPCCPHHFTSQLVYFGEILGAYTANVYAKAWYMIDFKSVISCWENDQQHFDRLAIYASRIR